MPDYQLLNLALRENNTTCGQGENSGSNILRESLQLENEAL